MNCIDLGRLKKASHRSFFGLLLKPASFGGSPATADARIVRRTAVFIGEGPCLDATSQTKRGPARASQSHTAASVSPPTTRRISTASRGLTTNHFALMNTPAQCTLIIPFSPSVGVQDIDDILFQLPLFTIFPSFLEVPINFPMNKWQWCPLPFAQHSIHKVSRPHRRLTLGHPLAQRGLLKLM